MNYNLDLNIVEELLVFFFVFLKKAFMPLRRAKVALPSLFWKAQQTSIDKSY